MYVHTDLNKYLQDLLNTSDIYLSHLNYLVSLSHLNILQFLFSFVYNYFLLLLIYHFHLIFLCIFLYFLLLSNLIHSTKDKHGNTSVNVVRTTTTSPRKTAVAFRNRVPGGLRGGCLNLDQGNTEPSRTDADEPLLLDDDEF